MKKTEQQKSLIRAAGLKPLFWTVVMENEKLLHIRNWLTGKNVVYRK